MQVEIHTSINRQILDIEFSMPRQRGLSRHLSATGAKATICHRMEYISAHGMGDLHMCEDTFEAEAYIWIVQWHMLP